MDRHSQQMISAENRKSIHAAMVRESTDHPIVADAMATAESRMHEMIADQNRELYRPIFSPVANDRLPLHHTDKDGIRYPSRIRQRARAHAQKFETDPQDVESRLSLALLEIVHDDPEILANGNTYGYILNRATWRITDMDKTERYRTARIYGPSLDETITTGESETTIADLTTATGLTTEINQMRGDIRSAMLRIDPEDARALMMQYVQDYSRTETAEIMQRQPRQIEYQTRKALRAARELLAAYNATDAQTHAQDCNCRKCNGRTTDATSPTVEHLPTLNRQPVDPNYGAYTFRCNGLTMADLETLAQNMEINA